MNQENKFLGWGRDEFPRLEELNPRDFAPALAILKEKARQAFGEIKAPAAGSKRPWRESLGRFEEVFAKFEDAASLGTMCAWANPERFEGLEEIASANTMEVGAWLDNSKLLSRVRKGLLKSKRLTPAQRWALRDGGWDAGMAFTSAQKKKRLEKIEKRLETLSQRFESNVDASAKSAMVPARKRDLAGVPEDVQAQAKARAEENGWAGYLLCPTQDYHLVMRFGESRALRRRMFQASSGLASEMSGSLEFDNTAVAKEMLRLRQEVAEIKGHKNYAAYASSGFMAETPEKIERFLKDMARELRPLAADCRAELSEKMAKMGAKLEPWDYRYALEKTKKAGQKEEDSFRSHYPMERTIGACLALAAGFFGCDAARDKEYDAFGKWAFRISRSGREEGHLMVDAHLGTKKMSCGFSSLIRPWAAGNTKSQIPLVYVSLNLDSQSGVKGLAREHIDTALHEFGHAMHGILTRSKERTNGSDMVEQDGLEIHSQFFERFAWEETILQDLSRHPKTGKKAPLSLIRKILKNESRHLAAKKLSATSESLFDLSLHSDIEGAKAFEKTLAKIRRELSMAEPKHFERRANSAFAMSGDYPCADYSYLWSEALARDAWAMWKKEAGGVGGNLRANRRIEKELFAVGAQRPLQESMRRYAKSGIPSAKRFVAQLGS